MEGVQVKTVHRVIMTGTPIQNRLTELWSLFDFVFPGKLGTLPVFQSQFGMPIQAGTYSNASQVAVSAAYKCAVMLRDMVSPYLLRRTKADVAKQLPKKSEQVLFCTLSDAQRKLYKSYLASKDVQDMLAGKRPTMEGITVLRKICNHADLLHRLELQANPDVDFGALERSSKLAVTIKVRPFLTDAAILCVLCALSCPLCLTGPRHWHLIRSLSVALLSPTLSLELALALLLKTSSTVGYRRALTSSSCRSLPSGASRATRRCSSRRHSRCWTSSSGTCKRRGCGTTAWTAPSRFPRASA